MLGYMDEHEWLVLHRTRVEKARALKNTFHAIGANFLHLHFAINDFAHSNAHSAFRLLQYRRQLCTPTFHMNSWMQDSCIDGYGVLRFAFLQFYHVNKRIRPAIPSHILPNKSKRPENLVHLHNNGFRNHGRKPYFTFSSSNRPGSMGTSPL